MDGYGGEEVEAFIRINEEEEALLVQTHNLGLQLFEVLHPTYLLETLSKRQESP